MGGRGGKSSLNTGLRHTGLDVMANGKTTRYYFSSKEGKNFYQIGIGGIPKPTPQNMTAQDFRERAKKNGATVKTLTAAEKNSDLEKYEKGRKATDKALNDAYVRDKTFVKGSRMRRIGNRVQRKK